MVNEKSMWVLAESILESAYGEGATSSRGQLGLALELAESMLKDATGGVFNYVVSSIDGMPAVALGKSNSYNPTHIIGVDGHSSIGLWKEVQNDF